MHISEWHTGADALPNDAPGDDCPDHGPHSGDDCPKCPYDDQDDDTDEESTLT